MITIKPCIYRHHRRSDGTYPVKLRVTLDRVSRTIPTTLTATPAQLTRSLKRAIFFCPYPGGWLACQSSDQVGQLGHGVLLAADRGGHVGKHTHQLARQGDGCGRSLRRLSGDQGALPSQEIGGAEAEGLRPLRGGLLREGTPRQLVRDPRLRHIKAPGYFI